MFTLNKLLKIALPVTTVTSATILTAWLISRSPELLAQEQDKDLMLTDFQEDIEEFKEQTFSEQNDQSDEGIQEEELDKADTEGETKDAPEPKDTEAKGLDPNKLLQDIQEKLPNMIKEGGNLPKEKITLPTELSTEEGGQPKPQGEEANSPSQEAPSIPSNPSQAGSPKAISEDVGINSESTSDVVEGQTRGEEGSLLEEGEHLSEVEKTIQGPADTAVQEPQEAVEDENLEGQKSSSVVSAEEPTTLGEADASAPEASELQSVPQGDSGQENKIKKDGEGPENKVKEAKSSQEEGQVQPISEVAERGNVDGNSNRTNVDLLELEELEKALFSTDEKLALALAKL